MKRFIRWYGAGPLHLVSLLVCFLVAGYAAVRLLPANPSGIIIWFVGAALAHDLVLLPTYSLLDRAITRRSDQSPPPKLTWVNHIRVPACLSGLLLLVWFPLILRLPTRFQSITTFSTTPYLGRWLFVTTVLSTISGAIYLLRLARAHPAAPDTPAERRSPPDAASTRQDNTG